MTNSSRDSLDPLREFVVAMTRLVSGTGEEAELLRQARPLLAALIRTEGWLPPAFAGSQPGSYRQYLLHCDPLERFSVVSFVWGQGARTPVHNHGVWGLVGMLRGAERCDEFQPQPDGRVVDTGHRHLLEPGMIEAVSPTLGDWHRVSNALENQSSISIHVYGGNIGALRRQKLNADTGQVEAFVSGYSSELVPNLWSPPA